MKRVIDMAHCRQTSCYSSSQLTVSVGKAQCPSFKTTITLKISIKAGCQLSVLTYDMDVL